MRASWTPVANTGEKKETGSFVYNLVRLLGSPFSYDVTGLEHIQSSGPAIYLANHLGAIGPLAAILSIPIRLYPWVIAEMMDFKRAPRYLFDDFVHPVLHLGGKFGMLFSTLLTKISVRLIRRIGAVSIDRFSGWTVDGFRNSLKLLESGKNLLIFPEDPLLPLDPETLMRHFMPGFATLCSLFQSEDRAVLAVYPTAVHAGSEIVAIGEPEFFHQHGNRRQAINEFTALMEERVRCLYLYLKNSADVIVE